MTTVMMTKTEEVSSLKYRRVKSIGKTTLAKQLKGGVSYGSRPRQSR